MTKKNKNVKILKVTHNIYKFKKEVKHSISIDDEEGLRVSYKDIARNGNFCAIVPNELWRQELPEIFLITDFTSVAYRAIQEDGSVVRKTTKII